MAASALLLWSLFGMDWWEGHVMFSPEHTLHYRLVGLRECGPNGCRAAISKLGEPGAFGSFALYFASVLGALGVGIGLAGFFRLRLPNAIPVWIARSGIGATLLIGYKVFDAPSLGFLENLLEGERQPGAFIALAAIVAVMVVAWLLAAVDEDLPTAALPTTPAVGRYARGPVAPPVAPAPVASAPVAAPPRREAKHVEPIELDFGEREPGVDADGPHDPFAPPPERRR